MTNSDNSTDIFWCFLKFLNETFLLCFDNMSRSSYSQFVWEESCITWNTSQTLWLHFSEVWFVASSPAESAILPHLQVEMFQTLIWTHSTPWRNQIWKITGKSKLHGLRNTTLNPFQVYRIGATECKVMRYMPLPYFKWNSIELIDWTIRHQWIFFIYKIVALNFVLYWQLKYCLLVLDPTRTIR